MCYLFQHLAVDSSTPPTHKVTLTHFLSKPFVILFVSLLPCSKLANCFNDVSQNDVVYQSKSFLTILPPLMCIILLRPGFDLMYCEAYVNGHIA